VADLSFHNRNAFFELGIADHKGKPVIPFCRSSDTVPFDRRQDRTIVADIGIWQERCEARRKIEVYARATLEPDYKVSNPVTQAKGYAELEASTDTKDQAFIALQRRVQAIERNLPKNSEAIEFSGSPFKSKVEEQLKIFDQSEILDINQAIGAPSVKPLPRKLLMDYIKSLSGSARAEAHEALADAKAKEMKSSATEVYLNEVMQLLRDLRYS
jgi:oligoendopeptidase F